MSDRKAKEGTCESRQYLTIDEVAYCTGTSRLVVQQLVEEELIIPSAGDPEMLFECSVFSRVRKILRIHDHLDVDFQSLGLVLNLLERIESLEKQLRS
jgi:hypothetical protein